MYIPCVFTRLNIPWPCIYMLYHHMYINRIYQAYPDEYIPCIYSVYTRYIHSYNPEFSAGQSSWSQLLHTRVWVIQRGLFHTPPGLGQGKRRAAKGSGLLPSHAFAASLPPLSLAGWLLLLLQRSVQLVPSIATGNDLNLGERWGCWRPLGR
jgi:hypothetical protein